MNVGGDIVDAVARLTGRNGHGACGANANLLRSGIGQEVAIVVGTDDLNDVRIRTGITNRQGRAGRGARVEVEVADRLVRHGRKGNRLVLLGYRDRLLDVEGRCVSQVARLIGSDFGRARADDADLVEVAEATTVDRGDFQVVGFLLEIADVYADVIKSSFELRNADFTQNHVLGSVCRHRIRSVGCCSRLVDSVDPNLGLVHLACIRQSNNHLVPSIVGQGYGGEQRTVAVVDLQLACAVKSESKTTSSGGGT